MVKIVMGKKPGGTAPAPALGASTNIKEDVMSLDRRLKMLEERHTNIRSKLQVTEQNMLTKNKNFFAEIKTLNVEMTEIKKDMTEIKDRMMSLIKEMESFARKESVDILKKYIDLWNPVKFVTKNDVEDIVRDVIEQLRREG